MTRALKQRSGSATKMYESGTGVMVDHDPPYTRYAPATRAPRSRGASDVQERAGSFAAVAEGVSKQERQIALCTAACARLVRQRRTPNTKA